MAPRYIQIRSRDGFTFVVTREAAMVSGTMRTMLSSESYAEAQSGILELNERAEVVARVIDYLYYNLAYKSCSGDIAQFDVPPPMALELLVAADYLDV